MARQKTRLDRALRTETVADDAAHKGNVTAAGFQSMMSFSDGKKASEEKQRIAAQSKAYREQIARQRAWTLEPRSKFISRWDILTACALCFEAIVTPFEVGILDAGTLAESVSEPLFWINRCIDCIFMTDIVIQCFLAYQEPLEKPNGGAWVYDNRRILWHYASSWLPLDLLTAMPIDLIVGGVEAASASTAAATATTSALVNASLADAAEEGGEGAGAGVLALVRMFRLVKCVSPCTLYPVPCTLYHVPSRARRQARTSDGLLHTFYCPHPRPSRARRLASHPPDRLRSVLLHIHIHVHIHIHIHVHVHMHVRIHIRSTPVWAGSVVCYGPRASSLDGKPTSALITPRLRS